ncbi:hypothetical protein ON064_00405 [Planococcus sp. A6]|uniref:hypothetical protein n=1 Tax=Planococcus sp. A6 TaxID=2992760 RepID=UPI00237A2247|nr:hypothetical protein [Planococcus sp. A6]MDE0581510.1 hypothetical protein [Planococcus sp. A6]
MMKNVTGYEYEEVTYVTVGTGREEHLRFIASIPKTIEEVDKRVTKHKLPVKLAQIFWLKNGMPI